MTTTLGRPADPKSDKIEITSMECKRAMLHPQMTTVVERTADQKSSKIDITSSLLPISSSSLAPPSTPSCRFDVVDEDCCDVALRFVQERKGKVGLIVHGSRENPGGGYKRGAPGQEEAICRRSNLVACVEAAEYPLPEFGSLYIPALYILRAGPDMQFEFYKRPVRVSAVVAPCYMNMTTTSSEAERLEPKYEEKTLKKIVNMLSTFVAKGITHLVVGAWGCEAHGNPPEAISALFRRAFDPAKYPFAKLFKKVTFAILLNGRCLRAFRRAFYTELETDNDEDTDTDSDGSNDTTAEATAASESTPSVDVPITTTFTTPLTTSVATGANATETEHTITEDNSE